MADFLKSALGIAAPFLPGPWGAVAGVGAGLIGQNESQGKANDYQHQLQSLASLLSGGFQQNAGALNQGLLQSSGIGNDRRTAAQKGMQSQINAIKLARANNGPLGTGNQLAAQLQQQYGITDADIAAYDQAQVPQYDPSFNPYQSLLDSAYSKTAIAQEANTLFNPDQLQGQFANNEAASRNAYEGAIAQAQAGAAQRGTTFSTANNSLQNQLRAQQASQNTAFRNTAYQDLANQQRDYTINQENTGNALMARGIDQAHSNLTGTYGMLSNGVDRGIGILGGIGGMYQSQADQQGQGIAQMLQGIAGTGTLADLFKKKGSTPPFNPNSGGGIAGTPPIVPQTTGVAGMVNPGSALGLNYPPIQRRYK